MLESSSGWGSPWQNSSMAFAIYCPTLGRNSISSRVFGKRPFLLATSRAKPNNEDDLLFQRPNGCRKEPRSLSVAEASFFHDGYLWMNLEKNEATFSARVRCSKTSTTIRR